MKTFFIGTAGLALLAAIGTIAGNAWLTANQRAEAEKPEPWADPSFTTTAVTTGGMLGRWMDSDGNLENGHSYIKGIYDLWKSKHNDKWRAVADNPQALTFLTQLWETEFLVDINKIKQKATLRRDIEITERERLISEARRSAKAAELNIMREYKPK